MKKIIIYFSAVIGICFLIPIFFTTNFKAQEVIAEEEIQEEKELLDIEKYFYSDFQTIRLLHSDGSIEEKDLDEYIAEVVSAEIPADYDIEAIKAQCVAARTYTIYRIINRIKA